VVESRIITISEVGHPGTTANIIDVGEFKCLFEIRDGLVQVTSFAGICMVNSSTICNSEVIEHDAADFVVKRGEIIGGMLEMADG